MERGDRCGIVIWHALNKDPAFRKIKNCIDFGFVQSFFIPERIILIIMMLSVYDQKSCRFGMIFDGINTIYQ